MRKVVKSQTLASHKRETTMVIYVPFIALPFVAKTKYFAKDPQVTQDAKNLTHATTLTQKRKEMTLVVYVLAIVPKTVKRMKFYAQVKKTVMDVIQKKSVDQKLRIRMEFFVQMTQPLMLVQFNVMRKWGQ